MAETSSRTAVIAALIGNLLIAATKAVAAAISGSSAMLSEAVHSFVDTGNEVLLLYGQHRAAKPPDRTHPLGYGREIYFWSFVVALLIFALGAGVSIYEGITHIQHPEPIEDPLINFAVYGFAALFEAISWSYGWSAFQRIRGDKGIMAAVRASKDPASFMVLFEDSAALVGIAIAAGATALSLRLDAPWIDGTGSTSAGSRRSYGISIPSCFACSSGRHHPRAIASCHIATSRRGLRAMDRMSRRMLAVVTVILCARRRCRKVAACRALGEVAADIRELDAGWFSHAYNYC